MEELELSLPFRENALKYVRHGMPDAQIEDVMGVAAARNNPGCVVKVLPSSSRMEGGLFLGLLCLP